MTHGNTTHGYTIGRIVTREYRAWCRAKYRCYDPAYDHFNRYGGRGIVMCERWLSDFAAFRSDMGPCPPKYSLERIDNNGPYSPENCRWATHKEQCNNRSSTRIFEFEGKRLSLKNWARDKGIRYHTLYGRLSRGMSFQDALSLHPLKQRH